MAIYDDKDNSEISIGDIACRMDDESLWRLIGYGTDLLGRRNAVFEPVRMPESWFVPVPEI